MLVTRMWKCDAVVRRESREAREDMLILVVSKLGRVEGRVDGGANLLNDSMREDSRETSHTRFDPGPS
jgi:hypothetical protein